MATSEHKSEQSAIKKNNPLAAKSIGMPNISTKDNGASKDVNAGLKPTLGKFNPKKNSDSSLASPKVASLATTAASPQKAAPASPAVSPASLSAKTTAVGVAASGTIQATSTVTADTALATSAKAKIGVSKGVATSPRIAKGAASKGSLNLIFGAIVVLAVSGFVVYLVLSKPKPKTNTENPVAVSEKKQQNQDEAWGKATQNSPVKIYKNLSQAPKGITLYLNRSTGEYYDVREVNETYRSRYTKNVNDYQAVKN